MTRHPCRRRARRNALAAIVSAAAAVTTACGSAAGSAGGGVHAAWAARPPLTKAQLAQALITDADVPGFTVKPRTTELLQPDDVVTADPLACQPIADVMNVRPQHPRQATAWATIAPQGAVGDAAAGSVNLSSYAGDDAAAWLSEIKRALATCTAFTATSQAGWTYRFTVRSLSPAKVGDDSAAYLMTNTRAPGGKGNVVSVVRTGGTLATFLVPQGTGAPAAVPDSVADRQDRKLRAGAAG